MPNFDFHAKHAFLTYPQRTLSPADGLAKLATICSARWSYAVVAREQHEDGGDHLHVLICFRVSGYHGYIMSQRNNRGTHGFPFLEKVPNQERAIFRSRRRTGRRISSQHPGRPRPPRCLRLRHEGRGLRRTGGQTVQPSTSRAIEAF